MKNSKKLMEDIPNKVRDVLGIVVDVNLHEEEGKDYIEIVTEPYPYPVSYKGQYHYRSGSTKKELKGAALDRFMLRKQGKTWDGVPVPYLKAEDLDEATFTLFRRMAKLSGRMDEADLREDKTESTQKSVQKSVQKIVSLIKADPYITTQAIADQLGINRSGVARHIKRLQNQGVIRRVGPDKGGYWEIISDEK